MSTQHATGDGTFSIGGDLSVNRLGFGAMRIVGDGVWGQPKNKAEAIQVLRRALDLGVNLIDTSDAYGPFVSEELIAEALYPYPANLVIATKGGLVRPAAGVWDTDASPAHMREAIEGSLKRLRVERIDLYQLHRIDPKVPVEETIAVLAEFQKNGKIKHIGLSEVSVDEIQQVQKMIEVVSVQNIYNLTQRKHEAVLNYCTEQNIAFIPWYPLATGELATDSRLTHIATKNNATPSQIALAWLLHKSPVILPIPGTSSIAHLEENITARDIKLSEEDMMTLDALAS